MTKEQTKNAQYIFDKNPKIDELFMNVKGEFFTQESLAKNSLQKGEKLTKVSKKEEISITQEEPKEESILGGSNADVKKAVESITEIPELEQLLIDEQNGQNRKGSKEAIEVRIQELKDAQSNE